MRVFSKIIALALVGLLPWNALALTQCECGEHATGITTYTVSGDDCCTSPVAPDTVGWFHEYANQGDAWKLVSTTKLDASEAQNDGCNPS